MSPRDLIVRCMAKKEGDVWVAVCIDFSLAAQASTLHEARQKLRAQILSYVRDAYTADADHAVELLTRRGPLRHQLLFAWCRFRAQLKPALRRFAYTVALPLKPAAV